MPIALIVEDEMLVRELVIDYLLEAGFEATAVPNADTAMETLQGTAPIDLLLTDIRMPGALDGWELGRQAIALRPDLRVVYATGYSDSEAPLSPRERRLSKPFHFDELIAVLKSLHFDQT